MPPLPAELFDYPLPAHLIAQTPASKRDASRLLVIERTRGTVSHHTFADLPQFLRPGDILFRNNAAVLPARLRAHRPSGGAVECFLLRQVPGNDANTWWCLLRPGKKMPAGSTFALNGEFVGNIVDKEADGSALVRFETKQDEPITSIANRLGEVPLPPYIERSDPVSERETDLERYQTVYANRSRQVAVAAPTAGLHFTPELLARLYAAGVHTAEITLHVGLGTFRPIMTDHVEQHVIHRETYELPLETQGALFSPTGRRIAVGTTSVRSIEDFLEHHASPTTGPHLAEAGIFLYPPRTFRGVDALITNFHQPRSTLLCLVAAFLAPGSTDGIRWLKEIYAEAIKREYRFLSYGDAMLIV